MSNRYTKAVNKVLLFSKEEAQKTNLGYILPEHILLGLIRNLDGKLHGIFHQFNIDFKTIYQETLDSVNKQPRQTAQREADEEMRLLFNLASTNILRHAVHISLQMGSPLIDEQHIILAILKDRAMNQARQILEAHNINYDNVYSFLTAKPTKPSTPQNGLELPEDDEQEPEQSQGERFSRLGYRSNMPSRSKTPAIDMFGTDLTQAAAEDKLDPVVGREQEILRVVEILSRRKKNNPVLIGSPGVGKSAIVEGLAQLIAKKRISPMFYSKRIISIDMTSVVAGTKYRGQFEERIKALMKEIEKDPNIIVFIDEIHTLVGAGSAEGSMDAANMLKPALARGKMQCIGATTMDEYRKTIEKDGALERRFQKVIVESTTVEETIQILHNIKERYEKHHHVRYTDEALNACVKLTDRYLSDRFLPDKAIDAMDEAGAHVHLQSATVSPELIEKERQVAHIIKEKDLAVSNQDFERATILRDKQVELEREILALNERNECQEDENAKDIAAKDVADVVARISGVPVQQMEEEEIVRLKRLPESLKADVIGQEEAIDKITKVIQRNRLGLSSPNRPIGVFMFIGSTGVGKTYLAQKLAEQMFGSKEALVRIDMSEYSESFNTSRLVGAPPGYVGYEEGGQLTEKVRRHPYSIVLLDEIEKAHGNVFNMLLQVLDEGRLTDGYGRMVNFKNTVIIMTSNVGTKQLKDFGSGIGFNVLTANESGFDREKKFARDVINKSLKKQFAPEFLNRLDDVVMFDQLSPKSIRKIVKIELQALSKRIDELGYHISVSQEAEEFLAKQGYDVQFGARPLKRAVQKHVENRLCDFLLERQAPTGSTLLIEKDTDKDTLKVSLEE